MEWKDATSYSKGERGKIEPTAWECVVDGVRVYITCGHLHYPGDWVVVCHDAGIDKVRFAQVADCSADRAKERALAFVAHKAKERANKLERLVAAISRPSTDVRKCE